MTWQHTEYLSQTDTSLVCLEGFDQESEGQCQSTLYLLPLDTTSFHVS